ncbi:hypothetical protein ACGFOW_29910 [Streptomyces rubiginosohelvolus]|uniref:hypothetical protein n=1 Tax=Streptomyces rubiginosohelvolus TaxID=67362 RepID=UPI00371AD1B1
MLIDSRLRTVHGGRSGSDSEQEQLAQQLLASLGPVGIDDVLDGTSTLIYLYMKWLREAHEAHEKDVVEYVVPTLVTSLKMLPKSVPPEAVPTMAGLAIAAATGLSSTLWRKQYGDWTEAELTPLEATAFLLAEHINRVTDDQNFASRMITEALTQVESGVE